MPHIVTEADSEKCQDSVVRAYLSLLESDIESGRHLTSLPDDLAQAILANLHHAIVPNEEIEGEVAL